MEGGPLHAIARRCMSHCLYSQTDSFIPLPSPALSPHCYSLRRLRPFLCQFSLSSNSHLTFFQSLLPTLCPSLPHVLSPYATNYLVLHLRYSPHSFLYYSSTLLYTLPTRSSNSFTVLFSNPIQLSSDYRPHHFPSFRPVVTAFIYCTLSQLPPFQVFVPFS